jgi:hypothetical protein
MYEYETNMEISALTGGLTWRGLLAAKVSRMKFLSQDRNHGTFHPNIIIL